MWDWAIWAALLAGAIAGGVAISRLARRTIEMFRAFTDTRRNVARQLDELSAKAELTARKAEAAGDGSVELQESVARLRVSIAQLGVLSRAIDEAGSMADRVAAYVPRK